jgi:hypothetical protein
MSIQAAGFRSERIRAGRFTSADARSGITIVDGRKGAFYRILNSGEKDFTVDVGNGPNPTTELKPTHSLDVAVTLKIIISTQMAVPIEGIYDYLNTERPIRSGRFNIVLNAADRYKIIDIAHGGGGAKAAYYRIFNSGTAPIEVRRATGSPLIELRPDQSFDFEITSGGARDIYINPTADATQIEGIYDFLGQA